MITIDRCYDSHLHLYYTGQIANSLDLSLLKSLNDLQSLKIEKKFFRQNWLYGFGWDQYKMGLTDFPQKQDLDKYFPDYPVAFSRADGHCVWLNSKAMDLVKNNMDLSKNIPGGVISRNEKGEPTGVFLDNAKLEVDKFIPEYTVQQNLNFIKDGIKIFNHEGFTHLREMTCHKEYFETLLDLEQKKDLTAYIETQFVVDNIHQVQKVIDQIKLLKKNSSKKLKILGLKIFFDGSLGSSTALISQNYEQENQSGLQLWSERHFVEAVLMAWQQNLNVSVHTIGNLAISRVLKLVQSLLEKEIYGNLDLEHCEVMNLDDIHLMNRLNRALSKKKCSIRIHFQPSHFLSDKIWLKQKLNNLADSAFRWSDVEKNHITFFFGSDSPIEKPSLRATLKALSEAEKFGIPNVKKTWTTYHQHPDPNWGPGCYTLLGQDKIQTFFDNEKII